VLRTARGCALGVALGASPVVAATIELRALAVDGEPVADAVVSAYALDAGATGAPPDAVMDQRARRFTPQVLAVQKGAEVTFPNSDDVSHHVYSFSPAKRFEIFLAKGGDPREVSFEREGVVTLGCNLHDWMLGYVVVLDTPWFAVTDGRGVARIEDVPAGRYRVEVWHSRAVDAHDRLRRTAEVDGAAEWKWELRFDEPLLPARDQVPGLAGY
jgi:plastocyanin